MAVDPARAKSLFLNASDVAELAKRAAYLDHECGDNAELRARVEALVRANEDSLGPPLGTEDATIDSDAGRPARIATGVHTPSPALDPSPISMTAECRGNPGPNVLIAGRYTLQEKIGEGGMGEVWVAKQSEPVKRMVALKLIKPGMDSRAVLQRFEQERQALALMDHTNIAKVLDAGMTPNGQPFFVMELVNGLPLNKFCDEARLKTNERLELFATICQAVQHAHQKGIVHRDLKPANVLITMIDGKPVPKVIDFGVAKATAGKLTDESMSTQFGAVVGTLEYMSPEQAGFSGEDIDTRADIYSLGVILYELLTGLRPIDAARLKKAAITEMIRIIREEEPSKPSTRLSTNDSLPSMAALRQIEPRRLMALLRGDLDWVVMKCLEKHRDRRYETPNALARDVQRYLDGDAVEACPPSVGYRMGKFLKRNKGPVLAASVVVLALVAGFIGTAWGLFRADRAREAEAAQRRIAVEQKAKAELGEQLAIGAVKKFRDAVANNPGLKNNPELDSLRKTLLKEPLAFFRTLRNRLQAERDTRPQSLVRLAQANSDLGNLTEEIGDKQDALMAYRESLQINQRLANANPTATQYQNGLAMSHGNIGNLLRDTGKPAEALMAYGSALAIFQDLADAHPTVTEFQSNLARHHNNMGVLLLAIGKPAEAVKAYESALTIKQKLVDLNPAVSKFQSDLAASYNNMGVLLSDTGKPAEAIKAYEEALAIRRRLAESNPAETLFQIDLAGTYNNIGVLLRITNKLTEAMESYEAALAIRRKLAEANPTVTKFQRDLAGSHNNIGRIRNATGQPAEAMREYEAALAIRRKLADGNPAVTLFQSELASGRRNTGNLLSENGKPAEAMKEYEAALAINEKLAREHPESPDFASDHGATLHGMAGIDLVANRFEEARGLLRRAIAWQEKALAINPRNPTYRQFLESHLADLITASRGLGDSEGITEAERELTKLRDSDPAMMALDVRLAAVLKGEAPRTNAERLAMAQRAYDKALHAAAAKLLADALDADPTLAEDRRAQYRYNAACAATLAGCGQGKDDPVLDDAAKAKLRKQALDWLKAELSAWKRVSLIAAPGNLELLAKTLAHWKQDADLAGIRDNQELAKLPDEERAKLKQLWDDVDAILTKGEGSI